MALFKQKKLSIPPAPPEPDFDISKPDFDDNFPKYTPTMGGFDDINKRRAPVTQMPKFSENIRERNSSGPVFIKIDKYENALDNIDAIRNQVSEIERIIENLRKIKRDEDQTLDEWAQSLNEIKEKLLLVDKSLFES